MKHGLPIIFLILYAFNSFGQGMSLPPQKPIESQLNQKCSVLRKVKIFCQEESIKKSGYVTFGEILIKSFNDLMEINYLCWNTAQNIVDKKWSLKEVYVHVLNQKLKLLQDDKSDFPNNNPKWGIEKYRNECSTKKENVEINPCELYLADFEAEFKTKSLERCYQLIEANDDSVSEYKSILRGNK